MSVGVTTDQKQTISNVEINKIVL